MKISFLSGIDFANVLTEYSYCLNKHSNIECKSICLKKHGFNYNIQHDYDLYTCSNEEKSILKKYIENSDVIIFGEESKGEYNILNQIKNILGVDLLNSNKKIIIWHPGSNYRNEYGYYNNHPLRNKIYKHLYAIDLYRLSDKNENDFPLFPYQYFEPNYTNLLLDFKLKLENPPWGIIHIPSNTNTKGTNKINTTINKLNLNQDSFTYKVLTNIPYKEVLYEKSKSLFCIDQFKPSVGGFGISSLEGIFNSNLTFSTINNISDSMFELTGKYECPIVSLGDSEEELLLTLNNFIKNTTKEQLLEYMEGIGYWLDKYYTPNSIVKHFKKIIE